jgi:uncharacterized membrane protein
MATMLGFIALVAVSAHLAPHLSRRDIFFGVTVSPDFHDGPLARTVSRRYAVEIWLLALVAGALVATSPMPVVSGGMLLVQTAGATVAFVKARQAVRPYGAAPATIREADLGPRPGLPGGLAAQLGPFLILLASAIYVGLHWDEVPARFPTHWNLAGKPDGWTAKSVGSVFRGLGVGLVACTMMWFTQYAVLHWTRLPRVAGADGDRDRRVRQINLLATLAGEYLVACLLSWVAVIARFAGEGTSPRLPLVFRVAPFALFLVGGLLIRVVRRAAVADAKPIGDTTPDSYWIFGRLYVNRADPTLFVEKRTGLGYTLNLGNPWAWLILVVFYTAIVLLLMAA